MAEKTFWKTVDKAKKAPVIIQRDAEDEAVMMSLAYFEKLFLNASATEECKQKPLSRDESEELMKDLLGVKC